VRVLHVASEVAPFAQSGGLADVVAGLPAAQAQLGLEAGVLVPFYSGVADKLAWANIALEPAVPFTLDVGVHLLEVAIRVARVGRVAYGFLDCPTLFDRGGTLYGPGATAEFGDNHLRFATLGKAALVAGEALFDAPADVLHLHDWQSGAAALYARLAKHPALIVTTIHNLAYRGIFPKSVMDQLGIPWSMFTSDQLEFYDQVSFLKAALAYSDAVTTVSPSYAHEILTAERGEALDGFLRWNVKRLVGIVNGIDERAWNPATDAALPAPFSRDNLIGKTACKSALADELGLPLDDDDVLIGVIARMTWQKGTDLVADIAPELHRLGARLVVLGSGEPELEDRFRYLAATFGEHIAVRIGFDLALSRRIYGGSDLFVMPSRFEPCGLGQLYAMRYGALPVVHAVGGLRDTVKDPDTGIRFEEATASALVTALERAIAIVREPKTLLATRRAAMARDSSWTASAHQYDQLYRSLRA
jgi:starch synthase